MRFFDFCNFLQGLEDTSSRIEMTKSLADLFSERIASKEDPREIRILVYLLKGAINPSYHSLEFNFSNKLLLKSLASHTESTRQMEKKYLEFGDVGLFIASIIENEKPSKYTLLEIHSELLEIAEKKGKDSREFKQKKFKNIIGKLSKIESKYLSRLVLGKLRLGLSDKTIIDAISWTISGDKSNNELIERLFGITSDLGLIAEEIFLHGIENVEKNLKVRPGIPIASKLVQREKEADVIFQRLSNCIVQPKLDGLRLQIHFHQTKIAQLYDSKPSELKLVEEVAEPTQVKIFSRNLSDITEMFPDIVKVIKQFNIKGIILDCEAVGFDPNTMKQLTFQDTIKRKRKYDIEAKTSEIPIHVNAFDILYLDDKSHQELDLTKTPLIDRIEILKQVLQSNKQDLIVMLESKMITSADELAVIFKKYTSQGLEGLIAKKANSIYEPGTRNYDWIKLKVASQEGLADTVDAVVLGYYKGIGSRSKLGIGALLLGSYDEKTGKYYSLAKLGTGVKENEWIDIKSKLDKIRVAELPEEVEIDKALIPDVIVSPKIVVEVEADEITKSKMHGGMGREGFSLRFPRLKIFGRDKNPEQSTNTVELRKLFMLKNNK